MSRRNQMPVSALLERLWAVDSMMLFVRRRMRLLSASIRLVAVLLMVGFSMSPARSQLVVFGLGDSGTRPYAGVTIDSAGNLYGTCYSGGAYKYGQVWELDTSGKYQDLHDFGSGTDGSSPYAGVTIDSAGDLYGTCTLGGLSNNGMIWEIDASGNYHDFHDFGGGTSGSNPSAGVTVDSAGNLYGTCGGGLYGYGMVWEIDTSGNYHDFYDFGGGTNGAGPSAVTFDSAGNLYGTCSGGGTYSGGMLWEIDTSGNYHDLHDFGSGTDGSPPYTGVTIDSAGNMYGTTFYGGTNDYGMVWELDASKNYYDLHDFGSLTDGSNPEAGVSIDSAGNLYGTCAAGNRFGFEPFGNVWEIDTSGNYNQLIVFGGNGGTAPYGGVTIDPAGNLCGTCHYGGYNDNGEVWGLDLGGPALSSFSTAPSALGGSTLSGSVSLAEVVNPLLDSGTVQITSDNSAIQSTSVVVPAGATETSFVLPCGSVTSQTTVHLTASKDGMTETSTVVLYPGLSSLTFSPASVLPGGACSGTVTLNLPAPAGGWLVNLSSNEADDTVPSSVTVPQGKTTASFPVTVQTGATMGVTVVITASDVDVTINQNLTVLALYTSGVSISPSIASAGSTATGTVTLNAVTPLAFTVNLSSQYPNLVGVPATLTIPANASSATFQITTKAATGVGAYAAWIKASDAVASRQATITVETPHVILLSLNPATVAGGSAATGLLYLNVPAPAGGLVVNLSSQYPNLVGVPASVTIPAGSTDATFAITTQATSGAYKSVIKATDPVGSQLATLTVVSP
jgi:hypothetical protein